MKKFNNIQQLDDLISFNDRSKTMLVIGQNTKKNFKDIIDTKNFVTFSDYKQNPSIEDAIAGAYIFKEKDCARIIAIGGGSAIDIAKTIIALLDSNEKDVLKNNFKPGEADFIVVPTTAGSGSEATHFAVIYKNNVKYSIAHKNLLPTKVILDPILSFKAPIYTRASSMFDALCQAIESFWSRKGCDHSKKLALDAIKLVIDNYKLALADDFDAHKNIVLASNLAGQAINITKTTAPHALSYGISHRFNIAHGHSVALTLANFVILHEKYLDNHQLQDSHKMLLEIFDVKNALEFKDKWQSMLAYCKLDSSLRDFSIDDCDIKALKETINIERLNNHPLDLTSDDLDFIYKQEVL